MARIIIAGAGGHAKVVASVIAARGELEIVGATDPDPSACKASGLKIVGDDGQLPTLKGRLGIEHAAIGLGATRSTDARRRLRELLQRTGFSLPSLVHPSAIIDPSVWLSDGCQVMPGAVVNAGASIGKGAVVNTGAVIEHDAFIGDDAFVGPNASIAGGVRIGSGAFLGIGAVVIEGVSIGHNAVVGAGAVVIEDLPDDAFAVGVPARARTRGKEGSCG